MMIHAFALLALLLCAAPAKTVSDYTVDPFCYGRQANLRSFVLDGRTMQLSIDIYTLQTSIHAPVKTMGHPCNRLTDRSAPYFRLLRDAAAAPYPLQNDGLIHGKKGIALTTDLCPSSKKDFERRLYAGIIRRFPNPVPVTLFITSRWIDKHPAALAQLRRWERDGRLAITWGNHTGHHPYHPKRPFAKNFALSPGYNLKKDILVLEKHLISKGITPSVFFRFPGLVSDKRTVCLVQSLGLISIGSDTWLAKGQTIHTGSIILVHGNKNEPKGVAMLLDDLTQNKIEKLVPLCQALW